MLSISCTRDRHIVWVSRIATVTMLEAALLVATLPAPPENEEVLTNFHQGRKPRGFWRRITSSVPLKDPVQLTAEIWADIYDCEPGVTVCAFASFPWPCSSAGITWSRESGLVRVSLRVGFLFGVGKQ